jgi:serpin B
VNEKTEKLIPRLLPDGYDTQGLAVVLMNALYFKDNWETAFNESATIRDDFHTEGGETVKKDFMRQTENYAYYEDGKTQAVILPMSGGINMAFVLGDESGLSEKLSKAAGRQVSVKIPKMDIETSLDRKELMNFLAENGVKSAFSRETADFSKMIDHKIWVDDIIQKTRIKTDEEGVEAAAVTAIMVNDTAMPAPVEPVEFVADRPFSFYIYATYDDVTAILFAGKMVQ